MTAHNPELVEYEASVTADRPHNDGLLILGITAIVVMTMLGVLFFA